MLSSRDPLARAQVAQTVWLQTCILDKDAAGAELKLLALAARLQDAELHARTALQDHVSTARAHTHRWRGVRATRFLPPCHN